MADSAAGVGERRIGSGHVADVDGRSAQCLGVVRDDHRLVADELHEPGPLVGRQRRRPHLEPAQRLGLLDGADGLGPRRRRHEVDEGQRDAQLATHQRLGEPDVAQRVLGEHVDHDRLHLRPGDDAELVGLRRLQLGRAVAFQPIEAAGEQRSRRLRDARSRPAEHASEGERVVLPVQLGAEHERLHVIDDGVWDRGFRGVGHRETKRGPHVDHGLDRDAGARGRVVRADERRRAIDRPGRHAHQVRVLDPVEDLLDREPIEEVAEELRPLPRERRRRVVQPGGEERLEPAHEGLVRLLDHRASLTRQPLDLPGDVRHKQQVDERRAEPGAELRGAPAADVAQQVEDLGAADRPRGVSRLRP